MILLFGVGISLADEEMEYDYLQYTHDFSKSNQKAKHSVTLR